MISANDGSGLGTFFKIVETNGATLLRFAHFHCLDLLVQLWRESFRLIEHVLQLQDPKLHVKRLTN
jgi:hypothetical protein